MTGERRERRVHLCERSRAREQDGNWILYFWFCVNSLSIILRRLISPVIFGQQFGHGNECIITRRKWSERKEIWNKTEIESTNAMAHTVYDYKLKYEARRRPRESALLSLYFLSFSFIFVCLFRFNVVCFSALFAVVCLWFPRIGHIIVVSSSLFLLVFATTVAAETCYWFAITRNYRHFVKNVHTTVAGRFFFFLGNIQRTDNRKRQNHIVGQHVDDFQRIISLLYRPQSVGASTTKSRGKKIEYIISLSQLCSFIVH